MEWHYIVPSSSIVQPFIVYRGFQDEGMITLVPFQGKKLASEGTVDAADDDESVQNEVGVSS